jgi:serine/threonine protein kinase
MQLSRGQVFANRYRLDRPLGSGGYASVFEATDPDVGRRVALKIIEHDAPHGYSEEIRARFKREAAAVANLRDPHTVTLFDYGEADGHLYLVFELVEGEALSTMIERETRLDRDVTIHIVRQVLHSLREAHQAGILHRDIKPENVIVHEYMGDPHQAKLVDFGLVRPTLAPADGLTKPGFVVGTPRYISPEGYLQQALSPASDIFSLGMVMYEMLVGHPANAHTAVDDIATEQASEREYELPASVPDTLQSVLARMIAKRPARRFQSAEEVLSALDAVDSHGAPGREGAGREFTAADFSHRKSPSDELRLDQEALADRGAKAVPQPRTRIESQESSGNIVKFGVLLTLLLVAASAGLVWYLDIDMPWNRVERVDPAKLKPKVFPIESEDTAVFWVDWTRGIVLADDPLAVPAAGRCVAIFSSRSNPTPPGAFYVANVLDGYPENVETTPIGRDELARRAELCNLGGDAAWNVQQSAEVMISRIRIDHVKSRKKRKKVEIRSIIGKHQRLPFKMPGTTQGKPKIPSMAP